MPEPITTITLNGIELPGLVLNDDVAPHGVLATVSNTLAGGIAVWEQAQTSGRRVDLTGGPDYGWLTRSVLLQLRSLANNPGSSYALITPHESLTVRFRNEDPPAVSGAPLVPRPNQADSDYYNNVQIKLMEV